MNKKLLFNITEDWFFCSHFFERAIAAKDEGYSIFVLCKENNKRNIIESNGIKFYNIPFNRKSINPIYELYTLLKIIYLYIKIKPDLVHHIAAKPIIYGSIASKLCRIKAVLNAPVGLGYVFSSDTFKARFLRPILIFLFKKFINTHNGKNQTNKVIFENFDDLNYFIELGAVKRDSACVIRGAGVKVSKKIFKNKDKKEIPTITLLGRMLKDKGVREFVAAAKLLNSKRLNGRFLLVGDTDTLNPSSLKKSTLIKWNEEKIIEWMGWVNDTEKILKETDILCLPSYREGLPKALIEGAAMGLPIVTTNTVGCRDVVQDGVNGFLVPTKNIDQLANKIYELIINKKMREKMGKESYMIALTKFESSIIISQTLKVYEELSSEVKN